MTKFLLRSLVILLASPLFSQAGPPAVALSKAQLDTAQDAEMRVQLNLRLFAAYRQMGDLDSSNYFMREAELLAAETGQLDFLGRIAILRGQFAVNAGDLPAADSLMQEGIEFLKQTDDLKGIALAYSEYSDVLDRRGLAQKGLEVMVLAQRMADSSKVGGLIFAIGINRAIKLRRMELYEDALATLNYIRPFHDPDNPRTTHQPLKWAVTAAGLYADLYPSTKDDEQIKYGLDLLDQKIRIADSLEWSTFQSDLRIAKVTLLSVHQKTNEEVPHLLDKVFAVGKARQDTFSLHQATMILQDYLLETGRPQAAYAYNEEVLAYANSLDDLTYSRTTLKRCYETAKATGRASEALAYYEQYTVLQDSLTNARKTLQYQELQERYDAETKERTILQLEKDKGVLAAQTADLRNRIFAILGLLLLLGLSGAVLYYRKQQSLALSREQVATTEQQLLRAQMNPHFIFNTLNSIKKLYVEGRTDDANDFLADFSQLLRQILERSYEASVPIEEEVEFLRLYLELERRRLGHQLDFSITFDPDDFEFDDVLPSMLLQPLAENAIWHGIMRNEGPGMIKIRIWREPNFIHCAIEDNGIGFYANVPKDRPHTSRGLELIRQRIGRSSELIIRELQSASGETAGTIVELSIAQL